MSTNPSVEWREPVRNLGEEYPLTVRQAAKFLGVSPQTVYLWVERKQIPHLRVMGRNIRFLRADLVPFCATFKQEGGRWQDLESTNGVAEVPLTPIAVEAFRDQLRISPCSPFLFPSDENPSGHQRTLKTVWSATLPRSPISASTICVPPTQRGSAPAAWQTSG